MTEKPIVVFFTPSEWSALRGCATGELESLTKWDRESGVAVELVAACDRMDEGRRAWADARLATRERNEKRRRPYRLFWTENGIFSDRVYGTFATAEAAWKKLDVILAYRTERRLYVRGSHNGWWVVTGPNQFREARGVGEQEGKPLPEVEVARG